MATKVYLKIVEKPDARAAILAPTLNAMPLFIGDGDTNLACGSCGAVVGRGVSLADLDRMSAAAQLLIRCAKCGVHGLLKPGIAH